MNHHKASGCYPYHASIRLRDQASNIPKPLHDVARLNSVTGDAIVYERNLQRDGRISEKITGIRKSAKFLEKSGPKFAFPSVS
jgi:hypothetical protein